MNNLLIQRLFSARLADEAKGLGLRVASPNIQFDPRPDELYLVEHLLPAITTSQTLYGDDQTFRGVYQVTVVAPAGSGSDQAIATAATIANAFPMNQELSAGSGVFVSQPPSVGAGIDFQTSYNVPVSVNYRADS